MRLAFRHINLIYTVLLAAIFIISLLLVIFKKGRRVTSILLGIFSIVAAITLFAFKSVIDVAGNLNESASFSEVKMSIVVPASSSISDVSELTSVQAPTKADGTNISALIAQIKKDKGIDLATDTVDSYQAAYENLIAGSSQAMVLSSAYSSLLELSYDNYESNLKTIYTYTIKKSTTSEKKTTDSNVFNIYIGSVAKFENQTRPF